MAEKKTMGRPLEYDEEFLKKAGESALEFANRPDSYGILGWRGETGYTFQQLNEWSEKSAHFSEMYAQAKAIIGHRREQGAIKNELNAQVVNQRAWQYDGEVRSHAKEMAKIESTGKVIVEGRVAPPEPKIVEAKEKSSGKGDA